VIVVRYESIQITSFRSIRESRKLDLDPRMTVVVGENNSGKTALLDAMAGDVKESHRSPHTVPRRDALAIPTHIVRKFRFQRDDLEALADQDPTALGIYVGRDFNRRPGAALNALLSAKTLWFESPVGTAKSQERFLGLFPLSDGRTELLLSRDQKREWKAELSAFKDSQDVRSRLLDRFFSRQVQRSRAERPIDTKGPVGNSLDAGPASERLASALNHLLVSDPPRMRHLVETVARIVPSVREISVPLVGDKVGVHVWPFEGRADLAVAIEQAGTGVWQVLSIVYALLLAEEPKVFLIDEPNNYLHPKAVLDLIALLKSHPQHQYVIATHSPEVISACEPGIVHRVWLEDGESQFEQIDPSKVEDQRRTLRGLGVRLSAFFGADEVLWVEGPTEEEVFPKLLTPQELSGLRILAVHDTGAFDTKDPQRVAAIYKKLVDGVALIPPAVGFFFDREDRSQGKVDQLKATIGDKLEFTERRLVECYFLDPEAIASTITAEMRAADHPTFRVTAADVEAWIRQKEPEKGCYSATERYDEDRTKWLETVHAAKLLTALFGELTEQRLAYDKTGHGPAIVEHILARDPSLLDPLRKELRAVLERGRPSDATASG